MIFCLIASVWMYVHQISKYGADTLYPSSGLLVQPAAWVFLAIAAVIYFIRRDDYTSEIPGVLFYIIAAVESLDMVIRLLLWTKNLIFLEDGSLNKTSLIATAVFIFVLIVIISCYKRDVVFWGNESGEHLLTQPTQLLLYWTWIMELMIYFTSQEVIDQLNGGFSILQGVFTMWFGIDRPLSVKDISAWPIGGKIFLGVEAFLFVVFVFDAKRIKDIFVRLCYITLGSYVLFIFLMFRYYFLVPQLTGFFIIPEIVIQAIFATALALMIITSILPNTYRTFMSLGSSFGNVDAGSLSTKDRVKGPAALPEYIYDNNDIRLRHSFSTGSAEVYVDDKTGRKVYITHAEVGQSTANTNIGKVHFY